MNRIFTKGLATATVMLVAGCGGPMGSAFKGEPTPYDGAWVGQFSISVRTYECKLSRGGIRATIEGGRIEGMVRQPGERHKLYGSLDESGTLSDAETYPNYLKEKAFFEGALTETEGEGSWSNEDCKGTWTLRKIR